MELLVGVRLIPKDPGHRRSGTCPRSSTFQNADTHVQQRIMVLRVLHLDEWLSNQLVLTEQTRRQVIDRGRPPAIQRRDPTDLRLDHITAPDVNRGDQILSDSDLLSEAKHRA